MNFKSIFVAAMLAIAPVASAMASDTGFYVTGNVGLASPLVEDSDSQAVAGGAVGFDAGPVRVEVDATRIFDGATNAGDVSLNTVSLLAYVEHDFGGFTPFVGGGVGYADFARSAAIVGDRDGVVYTATAGVRVPFSENWSGVVQYRYLNSDVEVVENGDSSRWEAHVGTVGISYRF